MSPISSDKDKVFSSLKPKDKGEQTTHNARLIIEQDQRASETKTAKLKALRLARDAQAPEPAPKPAKKPKR